MVAVLALVLGFMLMGSLGEPEMDREPVSVYDQMVLNPDELLVTQIRRKCDGLVSAPSYSHCVAASTSSTMNMLNQFHEKRRRLMQKPGPDDYTFVTAFKNIGRGSWDVLYRREPIDYIKRVRHLFNSNLPLVVFIEEEFYDDVILQWFLASKRSPDMFTRIYAFNDDTLRTQTTYFDILERETAIMATSEYKARVQGRPHFGDPETLYAEYNAFTHCKPQFVKLVLDNHREVFDVGANYGTGGHQGAGAGYIGWLDFGYLKHDWEALTFAINQTLFRNGRVNLHNFFEEVVDSHDGDFEKVLQRPLLREDRATGSLGPKLLGGIWHGERPVMLQFIAEWASAIEVMHAQNIADDDQAVMGYVAVHSPDLVRLWKHDELLPGLSMIYQVYNTLIFINETCFTLDTHEHVNIETLQADLDLFRRQHDRTMTDIGSLSDI
jgi:hypothetical protein